MPQEQIEQELSIEDDIAANLDSILAGGEESQTQNDVEAGSSTEGSKDAATAGVAEGTTAKPASTSTEGTQSEEEHQSQSDIEMPKSWGKAGAAIWETVPAEARAMIQKSEEDFHRGIAQYKQDADIGRTLSSAISIRNIRLRTSTRSVCSNPVSFLAGLSTRLSPGFVILS